MDERIREAQEDLDVEHDEDLTVAAEKAITDLEQRWEGYRTDHDFVGAGFKAFTGKKQQLDGEYHHSHRCITVAKELEDQLDRDKQEANGALHRILVHEATHLKHFHSNPAAYQLVRENERSRDDDTPYFEDMRNATVEGIALMEEYLNATPVPTNNGPYHVHQALNDPWTLPDFFAGAPDIDTVDHTTIRSPYNLGHFTAELQHRALTGTMDAETARNHVRQFFFDNLRTPSALYTDLRKAYRELGTPSYPDTLHMHDDYLSAAEEEERLTILEQTAKRMLDEKQHLLSAYDALSWYLHGSALIAAHQRHNPCEDVSAPGSVHRLKSELDRLQNMYRSQWNDRD